MPIPCIDSFSALHFLIEPFLLLEPFLFFEQGGFLLFQCREAGGCGEMIHPDIDDTVPDVPLYVVIPVYFGSCFA